MILLHCKSISILNRSTKKTSFFPACMHIVFARVLFTECSIFVHYIFILHFDHSTWPRKRRLEKNDYSLFSEKSYYIYCIYIFGINGNSFERLEFSFEALLISQEADY